MWIGCFFFDNFLLYTFVNSLTPHCATVVGYLLTHEVNLETGITEKLQ